MVGGDGAFGGVVKEGLAFEADGAGQDAAVDLWQGDVHGDVACGQAVQAFGPCVFGRAGEDDLEDGRFVAAAVGWRAVVTVVRAADGEGGAVEDDVGWGAVKDVRRVSRC